MAIDQHLFPVAITPLHPDYDPERDDLAYPVGAVAAGAHAFTYGGGRTLHAPKLYVIYFGEPWFDKTWFEQFCLNIMQGGYLSKLQNYGSGNGTFLTAKQVPAFPNPQITDNDIATALRVGIQNGTFPPNDENMLYMCLIPDGQSVVWSDAAHTASCTSFCGYHSSFYLDDNNPVGPTIAFTVQPANTCVSCHGGWTPQQALTMTCAHEIAEAATDTDPGTGWVVRDPADPKDGQENGDLVAWNGHQYGPDTVQGYYTNEWGDTLGTFTPVVQPTPDPKPVPPDKAAFTQYVMPLCEWMFRAYPNIIAALVAADPSPADRAILASWRPYLASIGYKVS